MNNTHEPEPRFNGEDYEPGRDFGRLSLQHERIRDLMPDQKFRTLEEIATITGDPLPSISAQLRHLRKKRFGSFRVQKKYLGNGLYAYQVLPPLPAGQLALLPDREAA